MAVRKFASDFWILFADPDTVRQVPGTALGRPAGMGQEEHAWSSVSRVLRDGILRLLSLRRCLCAIPARIQLR